MSLSPADRRLLEQHPVLAGFQRSQRAALLSEAQVVELREADKHSAREHLLFVLEGRVRAWTDYLGRELGAGEVAASLGMLAGDTRLPFGLRALAPTRLARLRPEGWPPHLRAALADQLTGWLERADEEIEAWSAALEDLLDEHARIAPGPYRFRDAELLVVVLDEGLPEPEHPLRALPFCPMASPLLVLGDFPEVLASNGASTAYREVSLFRPRARRLGLPGLEAVWIHPEHAMATLLGRELFGLPKRVARVERGGRFAALSAHNRAFELRWTAQRELPAGTWLDRLGEAMLQRQLPFGRVGDGLVRLVGLQALAASGTVPLFSHRWAGLREGSPRRELVEVPMQVTAVHGLQVLEGARLAGRGDLEGHRLREAFRVRLDCELVA